MFVQYMSRKDWIYVLFRGNIQTQKQTEENNMKTTFYFNGRKITKKAAAGLAGEERLKRLIEEAKDGFRQDPCEEQSWFLGGGILAISFC